MYFKYLNNTIYKREKVEHVNQDTKSQKQGSLVHRNPWANSAVV